MSDVVHYRIPLAAIGNQLFGAFILKDINKIFGFRREIIKEILALPAKKPVTKVVERKSP